ncbi:cation:proton antiporter [Paractinoplanes ferrugineus]|uniref:Potassium transporter n=1 Tax=Paractinoplanes ferrugineus TaxID=113564 RepID=A0A919JAV2_9ACTN|nr:potassium transporter [Actinoplanes ferrugineus]
MQVVAIMVAGFLLGPSVLGLIWPTFQHWMFPTNISVNGQSIVHPSLSAIYVIGQLGLVFYMFVVGASFDTSIFRGHMRHAAATSIAGISVPILLGGLIGWQLTSGGRWFAEDVEPWQGGLFLAAGICITAFPMLAWIVYDSGLLKSRLGTMALACAAADDAFAWIMLATVVAATKDSADGAILAVVGGAGYLLLMITVGRRVLRRVVDRAEKQMSEGVGLPIGPLVTVLMIVLAAAWFTDWCGIYAVFGAFLAGTVIPRGPFVDLLRQRLEPLTAYVLLPAFFIFSGLQTKLNLLTDPVVLLVTGLVLVASFVGKFGAVSIAARSQGMSWREAGSLGALMNARGLMELILLNIGLSAGVVTPTLYTVLALMAIITTFMATPLHRMFERLNERRGLTFGPHGETPIVDEPIREPVAVAARE